MATDSKPEQSKPATPTPARAPADVPQPDPSAGVADELRTRHEARTTVPGWPGVDARLDNRAGPDRPPLESFPAKPQQVDGPDVMGQVEHTAATLRDREQNLGDRKGMFSSGPHGLSDESQREAGSAGDAPKAG